MNFFKSNNLKTVSPSRGQDPLKPQSAEAPEARIRKNSIFGQHAKKSTFGQHVKSAFLDWFVRTIDSERQSCLGTDKAYIETYSRVTSEVQLMSCHHLFGKVWWRNAGDKTITNRAQQIYTLLEGNGWRMNGLLLFRFKDSSSANTPQRLRSLTKQAIDRWLQICTSRKSNTSNTTEPKWNKMLREKKESANLLRSVRNDSRIAAEFVEIDKEMLRDSDWNFSQELVKE